MTPMIWPICCDDLAMAFIASTAWRTTAALFLASSSAAATTWRACCVPSADVLHRRRHLGQRRRRLLEAGGLLLGAAREIVGRRRNLLRAGFDRARRIDDADNGRLELVDRHVEVVADLGVGRREPVGEPHHQIAARDLLEAGAETLHRLGLLLCRFGALGARPRAFGLGERARRRRLGFQPRAIERVLPEHVQRPRHAFEFASAAGVPSAGAEIEIAGRELLHDDAHRNDRPRRAFVPSRPKRRRDRR